MKALGLDLFAQEDYQTPMLTSIKIPDGINDPTFRKTLLTKHNVEIAGGLHSDGLLYRLFFKNELTHEKSFSFTDFLKNFKFSS